MQPVLKEQIETPALLIDLDIQDAPSLMPASKSVVLNRDNRKSKIILISE